MRYHPKSAYITNKPIGHLQAPQSRSKDPCQRSEGVSCTLRTDQLCLTVRRMLYEFHRQQNAKKPGSIHATYLLGGTKRKEKSIPAIAEVKKDGEDDVMHSSPFMASSMPQFEEESTGESSVLSITLVKEERLEGKHVKSSSEIILNPCQKRGHSMSTSARYISTVSVQVL